MVLLDGEGNTNPLELLALKPCSTCTPSPPSPCGSYLLLLGGVREPLFLLTLTLTVLLKPRLLRTCFSIQARRFVRLLCSDSTIRGHGLHSAMSRAAMAMARPTCRVVQSGSASGTSGPGCWVGVGCTAQWKGRRDQASSFLSGCPKFCVRCSLNNCSLGGPPPLQA